MAFGLISSALGAVRAVGGGIAANQRKQKNKGLIAQAFRQNQLRQEMRQGDVRQNTNESLNARGVLSGGAQATPTYTAPVRQGTGISSLIRPLDYGTGGTRTQQVARAGGGPGIDPYRAGASRGSIGAANTLSGGINADLTDQFALERKDLTDEKTAQNRANEAEYKQGLVGSIAAGVNLASNVYSGLNASAGMPGAPSGPSGAFGMPINPTFPSQSQNRKSIIGDGIPNYSFQAGD